MLPGTLLYVYLGAAGKAAARGGGRTTLENVYLALGLAATIAVTIYLTKVARKELRRAGAQAGR
jgi:uncharacterized membrane protein YdjX (TVP38/TMEM64 family)